MVLRTIVALLTLAAALTAGPATAGAPAASVAKAVTLSFSRGPAEAGQTLPESDFPTNIVTAWAAFDLRGLHQRHPVSMPSCARTVGISRRSTWPAATRRTASVSDS